MSDGSGMHRAMIRSSPYSYHAPSPPKIHIPVQSKADMDLVPRYDRVDSSKLTLEDFTIITGNRIQKSTDRSTRWRYEQRREAQRILDYLFLGPTSIIRDHEFLKREALTMVVVVRDSRAPRNLASVETASATLNLPFCYVDANAKHLVPAFNQIVSVINNHLLTVHNVTGGTIRGKLLVTCDTGNMLSPSLVAAYIMFMFGQELLEAVHFIGVQRFCSNFDDEAKEALLTWQGINKASIAVDRRRRLEPDNGGNGLASEFTRAEGTLTTKRGLDDMMDGAEEDGRSDGGDTLGDNDRFSGRGDYAPFLDVD
ncbi:uncharacterized protein Triagg1_8057 [Trichoderma aggressivum f. europaeum]|uniref:Uncharacterized protein n=1 Tax=Trichoderma aggressivum f. europaeum TaxID=173218 RepID=A0AAE1M259_9HYPO|nr:hypothetical protein Triagg1_8057 [Trichoderma aggressivum f. europaeum]